MPKSKTDASGKGAKDARSPTARDEPITFAAEPAKPTWHYSPWMLAIDSMCRGDTSHAADLFERCEPIPVELARGLAAALRGDKNLPFRLEAIGNPKPGQKRPGRRVENHAWRDIVLASLVYDTMNEGKSFEEAVKDVAVHYALGESLVRKAYTEQRENGRALPLSRKDFANRMVAPPSWERIDRIRQFLSQAPDPEQD
jgi:hypothetical protein